MILQIVALALGGVALLITIINVIKGLIRGFKKTLGSLVAVVLAIIVAAILTLTLCSPSSYIVTHGVELVGDMIGGSIGEMMAIDSLETTVDYYVSMLLSPFFFTICYCVLAIIFSIVMAIVVKRIPILKNVKPVANRLGGAGIGLVCGYIVSVIILMPIIGTLDLVTSLPYDDILIVEEDEYYDEDEYYEDDEYYDDYEDYEDEDEDEDTEEFIDAMETADEYVDIFMNCGCGPLYNALSSARFEGEKVSIKDDISVIIEFVEILEDAGESIEDDELNHDHVDMLNDVVDHLDASPLLKNTIAGVFSASCEAWENGEEFLGLAKMDVGELMTPVSDELISVLAKSTHKTITKDLHTMVDVFEVLIDSGILEEMGYDDMLVMLGEEGGVLDQLVEVVHENKRMDSVADEIAMLSVRAMASHLDVDTEEYQVLMNDVAGTLNSYAYMSREVKYDYVKADLQDAFDEYGVTVEGAALEDIVNDILDEFEGRDDITDTDVANYFTHHAIEEYEEETEDYFG